MNYQAIKLAYQHKIECLKDQVLQLKQQNDLIKSTNDNLIKTIAEINNQSRNDDYECRNRELQEMLESQRKRYEELQSKRYQEMRAHNDELNEKNNEMERMRIQHEKQLFRMGEEIKRLKGMLRQRNNENYNYEELGRSVAISSYLVDLKQSEENSLDRSNNLNFTNIERLSKSPARSRISMQKSRTNMTMIRDDEKKYSKQELKVLLKTMSKAGKSYRQGEREYSVLQMMKKN